MSDSMSTCQSARLFGAVAAAVPELGGDSPAGLHRARGALQPPARGLESIESIETLHQACVRCLCQGLHGAREFQS